MLERFGMANCKPVTTPMDPGARLSRSQAPEASQDRSFMRSVDYLGAIGSLQYLATTT
ncbi:hypothetical protein PAXINDRAFT_39134, partial [Paxillus involutus ATCC 200175]